jgi:hypothetical protein
MLVPPNQNVRLEMTQSSTTLASHAFSTFFSISFYNSFGLPSLVLALFFPLVEKGINR